ncbi:hypothetical protein N7468_007046 [Penicillium chermesinum]|uniref:KAR9-domain-containing protein n=1 Tax=Penicillium chermesinum TaxID=63820 RepID=A0A9W9NU50_9EURO|nr:uncharacterized protein N7468_007046 [Penicillium chermesinum]KAJ5225821.1 hypothetical protein N7468_007046 [Penicillium chermesinum]
MHVPVDGPSSATDPATSSSVSIPGASPPPAVSISGSPNEQPSTLRRLKSKSSLWSIGSNNTEDDAPSEPPSAEKNTGKQSILRRLSPGLAARVKLLDGNNKSSNNSRTPNVGRIPEEHLKELDSLHQDLSIRIQKKGQAWSGPASASPGSTSSQKRSASNKLELPSQDLLRQASGVREQGSPPANVFVEGPPLPVPSSASPAVTAPGAENSAPVPMSAAGPAPAQLGAVPARKPLPSDTIQDTRTDFEKMRPLPPRKTPPPASISSNTQSYFNPQGLHRADSIYSFSRASFSNQLSQLTSIPLPDPSALETSIQNISTALAAVRALNGAADQIQIWIRKASDVLSGLDAEDDVEWAAAGGREGLDGVDKAITRFESLVNVYVSAIEKVQLREDIANVDSDNLKTIVSQMESILQNWSQIKVKLRGVKEQVELSMEWEELWSNVLGDLGMEIDKLSSMIFEMEEKRHQTLLDPSGETSNGLDINELETIVEESPVKGRSPASNRFSLGPILAGTSGTPTIKTPHDDSSQFKLAELDARRGALRASLDFLPMRISMFQSRAMNVFPSAIEELEDRQERLEKSYQALEQEIKTLAKELGEDRWIIVFRNAGNQAQKMFDSVERSITKLQEGLESNAQINNPASLTKRIENYEAKKMHYLPAIERVISIIQKGLNERLTVNGEVLRLLADMQSRTDALKASLKVMDASLEDVQIASNHQLRDSISSILTLDSPATGSIAETPGSSPASSVILSGSGYKGGSTPLGDSSRRGSSVGSTTRTTLSKIRRVSGLPQAVTSRKSSIPTPGGAYSPQHTAVTPTPASRKSRATTTIIHTRKPSGSSTTPRPASTLSFSRGMSSSPAPGAGRSISRLSSRLASSSRSPARNVSSPTPAHSSLLDPPPYSRLRRPSNIPNAPELSNTPRSRQSYAGVGSSFSRSVNTADAHDSPSKNARPGTALGHSGHKRTSLLPLPKRDKERTAAQKKLDSRPPFRA